ncbi:MAG: exonuclease [Planctomycetes bacterium]|nr:exonuclease [Planctomycetota bacterium]
MTFAAIDFETADRRPASACAVGAVRVVDGVVVSGLRRLIRPPESRFPFARIHGIRAEDVASAGAFTEAWRETERLIAAADFVCAHNLAFELRVLHACCDRAGISPPRLRYVCTLQLARSLCGWNHSRLDRACRKLGITLQHHDPLSDATASAAIAWRAIQAGVLSETLQHSVPPKARATGSIPHTRRGRARR